jgi:tetratricopeptide (TPR) repeat protein
MGGLLVVTLALGAAGRAGGQSAPAPAASVPKAAPGPSFDEVVRQATAARESERVDDAIRLYRQGAQMRPAWDEGWWYLATLYYDKERWAEGRDAFKHFLVLKPSAGPGWVLRGLCEYQIKEYGPALEHLRKGVGLGLGGNAELLRVASFHTAILYIRAGEFERSLTGLDFLAKNEPESARLAEALGLMMLRIPKLPGEAPTEQRDLILAAGHAGYLHLDKRAAEAQKAFQDLLGRYPSVPNVHYAYGVFLLGQSSDDALVEFAKEIEIQPSSVYPHLEIAFERLRRGEAAEALGPAEMAVKLAPGLFAAHNALGRALSETGELERGLKELEQAATLAPDSPEMYFSLARAYAKAGRKEDADRARATFAELDKKRREQRDATAQK